MNFYLVWHDRCLKHTCFSVPHACLSKTQNTGFIRAACEMMKKNQTSQYAFMANIHLNNHQSDVYQNGWATHLLDKISL